VPCLDVAFEKILAQAAVNDIEAILTWCNCPSLNAAAKEKGIPVVHLEIGPLRWPQYRPTAYLDFSGVNGNTEAERRYRDSDFKPTDGWGIEALRRFYYQAEDGKDPGEHGSSLVWRSRSRTIPICWLSVMASTISPCWCMPICAALMVMFWCVAIQAACSR